MKAPFLFSILLLCILSSCKKNDCNEVIYPKKHLESDYGCSDTRHSLIVNLQNSASIIRSKADYDNEVTGVCHPEIDFSKYDLVIGAQSSGNEVDTILYDYRNMCPDDELTLTVEIVQSAAATPDNVVYHAIVPKLGDEETLHVLVKIK